MALLTEHVPDRGGQCGILQRDLAQYAVVARCVGPHAVIRGDVLGSEEVDDEFVDARKVFHEVPGILTGAESLLDQDGELIRGLRAKDFETGATGD